MKLLPFDKKLEVYTSLSWSHAQIK